MVVGTGCVVVTVTVVTAAVVVSGSSEWGSSMPM